MLLSRLSFACCLGLLYLILGSRTTVSACVTFTLSSVSVLQIHSHSVAVIAVHLMLWEEQQQVQVFASFPRGRSAAHRAAGSGCPQGSRLRLPTGQPALGRNRPVSILVETSGCCCRGSGLICQQVSLSPHPAERARSGVWVGTSGPVDLSSPRWAPPYSSRPRQLSQRGRTVPRAEEKSHRDFW